MDGAGGALHLAREDSRQESVAGQAVQAEQYNVVYIAPTLSNAADLVIARNWQEQADSGPEEDFDLYLYLLLYQNRYLLD